MLLSVLHSYGFLTRDLMRVCLFPAAPTGAQRWNLRLHVQDPLVSSIYIYIHPKPYKEHLLVYDGAGPLWSSSVTNVLVPGPALLFDGWVYMVFGVQGPGYLI